MLLYVFDMFHILLSGDSLRDLWKAYMYMYVYVYVCILTYTMNNVSCRFIKTAASTHPLLKFWYSTIELLNKIFCHLNQTLQIILNKPRQHTAQLTAISFLYNNKIFCLKTLLKKVIRTKISQRNGVMYSSNTSCSASKEISWNTFWIIS